MAINSNQYFATLPTDQIAEEILNKVDSYNEYILASGKVQLWAKSYEMFFRGGRKLGELAQAGEHSEYMLLDVNHYKSLLTNLHTMTTNQRPALDPRAVNTDTESTAQAKLAGGLLDYYMREKKVARYIKDAVKYSLLYGEGFVINEWNSTSGKEYGVNPETGAVIREGDLSFDSLPPHFIARDFNKMNADNHNWHVITRFKNKYDLAAKYPELADRITGLTYDDELFVKMRLVKDAFGDNDDVPVYTFYHKPTDAVPEGRQVDILASDLVLFDGPLAYRDIPVFRIAPEDEDFSIFGYTVGNDLLSLQEAINSLYSTVTTNQSTFGVQSILIPRGFNISVQSLTGGLNLIEYDPKVGKPEPLQLTLTAPEIFNFIQQLEKLMETLSGVNSVARGNPEANLKSGAALALVQSMAIQFNSGLQQSYTELLEDIGTSMINILKDFAEVPRIAMITGKYNRSYMREFSGKDLSQISRVVVDSGNPLSKTMAGKMQLAENMLQAGFIKTPDQYEMVLTTGNLDYMLEGDIKEQYNIRSENEGLASGEPQQAIITDSHALHIQEHKNVLASPEARKDPKIIQATVDHIMQHIQLLKTADPALLTILGQQPVGTPQAMGGQPMPGSTPAVEGAPTGIGAEPTPEAAQVAPMNPVTNEAAKINLPNMPTNPMTGTKAPQGGGM
jgi:hypothetical protein